MQSLWEMELTCHSFASGKGARRAAAGEVAAPVGVALDAHFGRLGRVVQSGAVAVEGVLWREINLRRLVQKTNFSGKSALLLGKVYKSLYLGTDYTLPEKV